MSVDHTVGTLQDRAAIEELLYNYCRFVDAVDVPAIVALFTDDATFDMGHGRVISRPEFGRLFESMTRYSATSHHLSNISISSLGEDVARVESVLYAFHRIADTAEEIHLWGRYSDEVVRHDGVWRVRSRRLRAAAEKTFPVREDPLPIYELIDRTGRG